MPPQSRGSPLPNALYSRSTPNLPTLTSLETESNDVGRGTASSSSAASPDVTPLEDYSLDPSVAEIESGSSSTSDSDGAPISKLPQRPLFNLASRSNTYLGPSTFAPPFYNRPPTPLPPSPSLTSLLRPSFSAQTSRASTPEPSSDEGTGVNSIRAGTQTPNSAAASTLTTSFRTARPIPRASPKVPTYEYYGFSLYLSSSIAFLIYLLWSFLPSPFLHQLGIYYYPNRWWSLAIPAWLVVLILWIYVALASYNTGYLTLEMSQVECLVDEAAQIAVVDEHGTIVRKERASGLVSGMNGTASSKSGNRVGHGKRDSSTSNGTLARMDLDWAKLWTEGTDAVMDVPIGGVCEVLYGVGRQHDV